MRRDIPVCGGINHSSLPTGGAPSIVFLGINTDAKKKAFPSTSEAGFHKTLTIPIFRFCENGMFRSMEHGGQRGEHGVGPPTEDRGLTDRLCQILYSFYPLMWGGTA